jgi:selenide,water dikinase
MKRLNETAGRLALEFGLRGGTDITGFGLLGHASEMAQASGVQLQLDYEALPFLECARRYAALGTFAGGLFDNQAYFGRYVELPERLDEPSRLMLFDPQTSGGLLLGLPPAKAEAFEKRARELGQSFWIVGDVKEGAGIRVK